MQTALLSVCNTETIPTPKTSGISIGMKPICRVTLWEYMTKRAKKLIGYTYDAWGLRTTTQYNGAPWSVVTKNSLGYRGYYYDSELGFYCLGTRYYDQNTHRFISPDRIDVVCATPGALTDKNLYAYCDNNPVMRVDRSGNAWWQAVIGGVIGLAGGIIDQWINNDWSAIAFVRTGISAAEGAITAVVNPFAGFLISGTAGDINSALAGNNKDQILADALVNGGISIMCSGVELAAGFIQAKKFVSTASKTQLKTAANALGYAGRNFKIASSWTGEMMLDISAKFMKESSYQALSLPVSFLMSVSWAKVSPW